MKKNIKKRILYVAALIGLITSGCKKFVEVPPPTTSLVAITAYSNNATAASAINGIYATMRDNCVGGGGSGISVLLGLSADEFQLYPGADFVFNQFYINGLKNNTSNTIWSNLYNCIYQANVAIEQLGKTSGVTGTMKQQLTGEAKFIRGFCYFYLVNIYGDVPLTLTSNYQINRSLSRTPASQIFQQVIVDLKDAQNLLSDDFLNSVGTPTAERVRPNKGAASALLARAYLYTGDYANAKVNSTKLIDDNSRYTILADLDQVFLTNNQEAIWQLELPNNGANTNDAGVFLPGYAYFGGPAAYAPVTLNDSLISNFDISDKRMSAWTVHNTSNGKLYYYPFKYKLLYTGAAPAEYPTVLRLAEQYLIRAECAAQLGDLVSAKSDLNVIRARAGLAGTTASSKEAILLDIEVEWRHELFSEYGHRWLNLKRTHQVDSVMGIMTPLKGGVWISNWQLYPIHVTELQYDPNLSQNPGY